MTPSEEWERRLKASFERLAAMASDLKSRDGFQDFTDETDPKKRLEAAFEWVAAKANSLASKDNFPDSTE